MLESIQHFGYLGIFVTIILEVGLMIFPLPGDTLLFATGIMSESGVLNHGLLLLTAITASVIAGHIGYFIGTKIDREILINNRFYRIKDSHLHKTEKFFEKYGFYAIIFSRFVPIVRNFLSQILGIIQYDKKKFFIANLIASIIWPMVIINLGFVLGRMFPELIVYAEYGMVLVLVILCLPVVLDLLKKRREAKIK